MDDAAASSVQIGNTPLTPSIIAAFIEDAEAKVTLSSEAYERVRTAHQFLQKKADQGVVYGVNTGFGPMASHIIGKHQLQDLQYNLIRSHASGVGPALPERFVISAMLDRLNTLAQGRSGVSEEVLEQLMFFINNRIAPVIPEHGAVGTSGDLVQLAHIALALIGEGESFYKGERMPTSKILQTLGRSPLQLGPKEGLALINGTSVMTGIAALLTVDAKKIIDIAIRSGALALELVHAFPDAFDPVLQEVRPHKGQSAVAAQLRSLFKDSQLLRDRVEFQSRVVVEEEQRVIPEDVQEVYSFRCLPQILGPVFDIQERVTETITTELNSVTDNPIIDMTTERFLHGGNFHGDYIAVAMDQLKIGLIKTSLLSERRINFFLNRGVNRAFPPFLNMQQPGFTLALQGMQFVATSTAAHNQSLAYPHSLHSISTNADNQDIVSMGTDAALITERVVTNTFYLLALELFTLAQAVDLTQSYEKLSGASKKLVDLVRTHTKVVSDDRSLTQELESLHGALRSGSSLRLL